MFVSRSGSLPVLSCCALAALLSVGGCASTQAPRYSSETVAPSRAVAQAAPAVEDDGLPAQTPPPAYIRQLPDDPSEPFSPNYGGGNPAALDTAAVTYKPRAAVIPDDLPPDFRRRLTVATGNQ